MGRKVFNPVSKVAYKALKNGCSYDLGLMISLQEKMSIAGEDAFKLLQIVNAYNEMHRQNFQHPKEYTYGAKAIAIERERQLLKYDANHDEQHGNNELLLVASYYSLPIPGYNAYFPPTWDLRFAKRTSDPIPTTRDLSKAGALIAAEIDRRIESSIMQYQTSK